MSERISEERLRDLERDADQGPCADRVPPLPLVAEIRRLREMLVGLPDDNGAPPTWHDDRVYFCGFCNTEIGAEMDQLRGSKKHAPGCPWLPIEAEVAAIRAETPDDYVPVTQP